MEKKLRMKKFEREEIKKQMKKNILKFLKSKREVKLIKTKHQNSMFRHCYPKVS